MESSKHFKIASGVAASIWPSVSNMIPSDLGEANPSTFVLAPLANSPSSELWPAEWDLFFLDLFLSGEPGGCGLSFRALDLFFALSPNELAFSSFRDLGRRNLAGACCAMASMALSLAGEQPKMEKKKKKPKNQEKKVSTSVMPD
jgi:hypothetical protein